ncbi:MAG: hypothetical protein OXD32_07135 [Endozoicomonadaceae bacterium]|nr:hypothetical protein [Endozoicomonadaceae bacterium]
MRSVPALRFHYDESLIRAGRISSLIDKVIREDEKNRQEQKITNKDGSTDDQT